MIAFNFRPDRMRQLTEALAPEVARVHDADRVRGGLAVAGGLPAGPPGDDAVAGRSAQAGLRQLHVAETEKYPHVTYFFGGGEEDPEPGERRELVPRPRDVPTYDHKPR